mmetsp:Transcript_127601/g.318639  ORF Transcript_127601/g.318639 Transcript_127601/m.318639 type:complete len:299 (-) Transcript_127601:713-1609(-)
MCSLASNLCNDANAVSHAPPSINSVLAPVLQRDIKKITQHPWYCKSSSSGQAWSASRSTEAASWTISVLLVCSGACTDDGGKESICASARQQVRCKSMSLGKRRMAFNKAAVPPALVSLHLPSHSGLLPGLAADKQRAAAQHWICKCKSLGNASRAASSTSQNPASTNRLLPSLPLATSAEPALQADPSQQATLHAECTRSKSEGQVRAAAVTASTAPALTRMCSGLLPSSTSACLFPCVGVEAKVASNLQLKRKRFCSSGKASILDRATSQAPALTSLSCPARPSRAISKTASMPTS